MDRREFLKSTAAVIISISVPDIVTGAVRAVGSQESQKIVKLQLQDVEIVEWQDIGSTRVAIVRAQVPFKNDRCYVLCSINEKLLDNLTGLDFLIKDIMTSAELIFKRDKGIDIRFEGYQMPSKIKDISRR